VAERLGLARPQLSQNWLTREDVTNLLGLADFETIRVSSEILWPLRTPGVDALCNRFLVKLWPFRWFGITNLMIARPKPSRESGREPVVSVVVPARNEEGNIPQIFDRVPQMGGGTELIFVEGHSKDDTYAAIEREMSRRPGERVKLFQQTILDADLTVPPEDLPRVYAAWRRPGEAIS
jgi:hypothetical protein